MATNTLIGTDDDLGDIVSTYVFDVGLARSFRLLTGLTLAGCLVVAVALSATHLLDVGGVASVLIPVAVAIAALAAAWGLAIALARLRRSDDQFVLHHFGLAHHHGDDVARTRWVDIALVTHSGTRSGSRVVRWHGSDYVCRIDLRDGTSTMFDNYIIDAAALGQDIERRSLL